MPLPSFNDDGLLPPGDYELTIEEIQRSFLVQKSLLVSPTWDQEWRHELTSCLSLLANQLWEVGVSRIYIDGSFVEAKDHKRH